MNDHLYALVIAGGRGTRFWPRSRRRTPKQCIALGTERTLIQQTVDRIRPLLPAERILVVTSWDMAETVIAQLPELPGENFLVEPVGRNTAPAVGWGCMDIARRSVGETAVVAVLPSDHIIEDEEEFLGVLRACAAAARATNALVTIGLQPTRAETGYGYLRCGGTLGEFEAHDFLRVRRFVEKPNAATAAEYLASGDYLWNAGMFVFTVEAARDAFRQHLPKTWALLERLRYEPADLARLYPQMDAISIDYGIMERSRHVLTVRAELGWSDVGSWPALAEHLPRIAGGRGVADPIVAVDSSGNIVHAPGKVVALVGVEDLIVVDTGDALLVCRKDQAQRVREVIEVLEERDLNEVL
ncbi:MAG TPA: sugar phosphate nucleotidyltransferase [Myxococcota bacterium]|nr:sugar phosphate nucleotidyltransferase [Myxococcota bacterium]